jgi:hypothetical protein
MIKITQQKDMAIKQQEYQSAKIIKNLKSIMTYSNSNSNHHFYGTYKAIIM